MLRSLQISNYALIEKLNLEFESGFNIITGETGAGKSIMLGALSLILGERAETKALRNPSVKAVVEAKFTSPWHPILVQYCKDNDIEWFDDECIIRREIAPNGRSRAFVNDSPVTLEHLQNIAIHLIDLHSQHQNRLLSSAEFQFGIIDAIADNAALLEEYSTNYARFRKSLRKYHETRRQIQQMLADQEYLRFQLSQLEELNPQPGEHEQLERQRDLLANITEVKGHITKALDTLSDGETNVIRLLDVCSQHVDELANVVSEAESLPERLEAVNIELQDIAETLATFDSGLTADPAELEQTEHRLNILYELEHRHGVESAEGLIEVRDKLKCQLSRLDNSSDTLKALENEARQAKAAVRATARQLTDKRVQAAKQFSGVLTKTAAPLGMKNLQVQIAIEPAELSANGADSIEFRFAFNKNQTPIPVASGASGGEISRLMLSIKSIIASRIQLPTIIFDEIDTGVSGKVANQMGEMMAAISANIQVLAITHLPQVAAQGNAHYKVYKYDDEQSTHTSVKKLTAEQRVDEIAQMLSGSAIDDAARAAACSLLQNN
ncbi:MAG: DNA repair protein RecN [Muribaculum sp.]|nr:DNA repair protein RecN [Muribaculaceae bacterium]MCM1081411.1 DNA repair protein RecN [Muribaculum sp.]